MKEDRPRWSAHGQRHGRAVLKLEQTQCAGWAVKPWRVDGYVSRAAAATDFERVTQQVENGVYRRIGGQRDARRREIMAYG